MKSERLLALMPASGEVGGASNTIRITGRYTSLRLNRELLQMHKDTKINIIVIGTVILSELGRQASILYYNS